MPCAGYGEDGAIYIPLVLSLSVPKATEGQRLAVVGPSNQRKSGRFDYRVPPSGTGRGVQVGEVNVLLAAKCVML